MGLTLTCPTLTLTLTLSLTLTLALALTLALTSSGGRLSQRQVFAMLRRSGLDAAELSEVSG